MDNLTPDGDNQDPIENQVDVTGVGVEDGNDQQAAPAAKKSWKDELGEYAQHPALSNFKEPKDLAKSWVNAQRMIGGDKVVLPGKKATEADWQAFYDRVGRPKDPDGYKIPEDYAPPEVTSPEGMRAYKEVAHKMGLLPQQAEGLYKWWADQQAGLLNQSKEQMESAKKSTETALRKEYGYAYEQKLNDANKLLMQFNSAEDAEYIKQNFGNDPVMVKFLIRMGGRMAEDGIVGKGESNFLSPDEAMAEIAKIKANPAYLDAGNPEQKLLVQRMRQLHRMAYPNS